MTTAIALLWAAFSCVESQALAAPPGKAEVPLIPTSEIGALAPRTPKPFGVCPHCGTASAAQKTPLLPWASRIPLSQPLFRLPSRIPLLTEGAPLPSGHGLAIQFMLHALAERLEKKEEAPSGAVQNADLAAIFDNATDKGSASPQSIALAAVDAGSDGEEVYRRILPRERLVQEEKGLNPVKQALSKSVEAALPFLEESVLKAQWRGPGKSSTLSDPCCGDAAPKLGLLLRQMGRPVDVVDAEMHYYLIYRLPEGQIVVDPTIRQFFGGSQAPADIPTIFVGTVSDLSALFQRHARSQSTSYGMDWIYFEHARVRNARLQELQASIAAQPEKDEYGPLARFLRGWNALKAGN